MNVDPVPARTSETILSLQYLRGLAALMVVSHHAHDSIPSLAAWFPHSIGFAGVDIFFVISGFIMVATTQGRSVSPWDFLRRRIIRVVPLYWILTLAFVGAMSLSTDLAQHGAAVTAETLLKSLLFIPHYSPSHPGEVLPLLVPGWTLNFEMYFYVLFALCLVVPGRLQIAVLTVFLAASVVLGLVAGPFHSAIATTYTSTMLLEFAAGALLAAVPGSRHRSWPEAVSLLCLAGGLSALAVGVSTGFDGRPSGDLLRIGGAVLCVLGALKSRLLARRFTPGVVLGDASYSIYLTHLFTLGVLRAVWGLVFHEASSPLLAAGYMLLALASAAIAGCICYYVVERPLLAWLRKAGSAGPLYAAGRRGRQ